MAKKKIRITKGDKGWEGTKAPEGDYIHERQKSVPRKKEMKWRSVTLKNKTVLRQYYDPEKRKWITQSVLEKIKK